MDLGYGLRAELMNARQREIAMNVRYAHNRPLGRPKGGGMANRRAWLVFDAIYATVMVPFLIASAGKVATGLTVALAATVAFIVCLAVSVWRWP